VSIFLDEHLVMIVTSSRNVVLNQIQWFVLVTFKNDVPKNEVHELGDSRHTLFVYCGRYIHITSEDVSELLNKSEWSYLMELAGSCIDKYSNSVTYTTKSYNGETSVSNLILSVHHLKQMLLTLQHCMMR
jgi:hypothetical protein